MHATSTPNLAQPKTGALGVLAATAILAAGLTVGALVGINLAPVAAPVAISGPAVDPLDAGFRGQRNGEIGAMDASQRAFEAHRRSEINAGLAPAVEPVPVSKDTMTQFDSIGLSGVITPEAIALRDQLRGDRGWWASNPSDTAPSEGNTQELGRAHR